MTNESKEYLKEAGKRVGEGIVVLVVGGIITTLLGALLSGGGEASE